MFSNITFSNGKIENEEDLIRRNIGMDRGRRKKAANYLGLNWKEYRQAEQLIMESSIMMGDKNRLLDKKRKRG